MAPTFRTLQIERRKDGKFITRSLNSDDGPLGVDTSLSQAIGTAVREATRISKGERVAVVIDVEQPNGRWRRDQVVRPPEPAKPARRRRVV